ncbi:MAG: hypothetical protein KA760_07005 [Steroidobacteraceae bacterium]|jgi:hypothetical protein|nr:hypothetical protein [Pseudomonadota bacterium]MBP7609226.1 hypothetical protein [Steroidobacteraceae bacterium]
MKTMQIRLAAMLTLSGLLSAIAGCGGNPARATAKPSNADFSIEFAMDGSGKPTGMTITPDDGDAWLEVVKQPGPRDNQVVWTSKSEFKIRFGQIDDPQLPLKRNKRLGDEKEDWNLSTKENGQWVYRLRLSQGSGSGKREVVGAKYFVKHLPSGVEFDPVIIVGRY